MERYFIEVAYKGSDYSGFQVQENARTIQSEVTRALETFYRQKFVLTGASRTDAGVHALQNFFHLDSPAPLSKRNLYNINAILSRNIVVKNFYLVNANAHCRFNAIEREYKYFIFSQKDPFLNDRAWYYPYKLEIDLLQLGADIIKNTTNFTSFSRRNTQVKNFLCTISGSQWLQQNNTLVYNISGNRFLRGMVRALVATMLKLARKNITVAQFQNIINTLDNTAADFSAPAHGLFLVAVKYPQGLLKPVE